MSSGAISHETIGELPLDPELFAVDLDRGRVVGVLLDGYRVCSGSHQSRGHHVARRLIAGRTR